MKYNVVQVTKKTKTMEYSEHDKIIQTVERGVLITSTNLSFLSSYSISIIHMMQKIEKWNVTNTDSTWNDNKSFRQSFEFCVNPTATASASYVPALSGSDNIIIINIIYIYIGLYIMYTFFS